MKIIISDIGSKPFHLRLPSRLILSRVGAGMVSRKLVKKGVRISPAQLHTFMKAIKKYKKSHPDWVLVDITDKSSSRIHITL